MALGTFDYYSEDDYLEEQFRKSVVYSPTTTTPWTGWEKDVAGIPRIDLPFIGMAKQMMFDSDRLVGGPEIMGAIGAVTEFAPYVRRFTTQDQREKFMALDQQQQTRALLLDTLEATLIGPIGGKVIQAGKEVGGAIGETALSWIPRKGRIVPTVGKESKVFAEPFNYTESLKGKLKSKGFGEDEAGAVGEFLQGGSPERLKGALINRAAENKAPTKAFKEAVETVSGRPYVEFKVKEELAQELSESALRTKFYRKGIRKGIKQLEIPGLKGEKITDQWVDGVFKAQAKRFYGDKAINMKLGELPEEVVEGLIYDMVNSGWKVKLPGGKQLRLFEGPAARLLQAPGGLRWPVIFSPQRKIFGSTEEFLGTKTNIYDKVTESVGLKRTAMLGETLRFSKILENNGLLKKLAVKDPVYQEGKLVGGRLVTKAAEDLTQETVSKSMKIMQTLDDYAQKLRGDLKPEDREVLQRAYGATLKRALQGDDATARFVRSWREFSDNIYAERGLYALPRMFEESGLKLSSTGRQAIDKMMQDEVAPELNRLFKEGWNDLSHGEKITGMQGILDSFKSKLAREEGFHPWFRQTGKPLEEGVKKLEQKLKLGGKDGYMDYLDSYVSRVSDPIGSSYSNIMGLLTGEKLSYFAHLRKSISEPTSASFEEMFMRRVGAQTTEQYLMPGIMDAARYARKLPQAYRNETAHFISRIMGQPSSFDRAVAERMSRHFKDFTPQHLVRLGRFFNDVQYMAGLGVRSFSALRNLFQPLINVPADLGGLRSFEHLALGAVDVLTNPKTRQILKEAKVITEYAPDILRIPRVLPRGARGLERGDAVEASLWMFKGSDRWNRLVTGAAALRKWRSAEHLIAKNDGLKAFSRKAGLLGREDYIRHDILNLVKKARSSGNPQEAKIALNEARNKFIKDVVSDTQYLYGSADSPRFIGRGGIPSMMNIFQSWWQNYGSMLAKWTRTGDISTKAGRAVNWMISTAVAGDILTGLYGAARAHVTVGTGPFPDRFPSPPIFGVVKDSLQRLGQIGKEYGGLAYTKELSPNEKRRLYRLTNEPIDVISQKALRSGSAFMPGGVLARKVAKETQRYGPGAIPRAILEIPSSYERSKTPRRSEDLMEWLIEARPTLKRLLEADPTLLD